MHSLIVALFLIGATFDSTHAAVNEFVTCDFDLVAEVGPELGPKLERQLPQECQNVDDSTRAALLKEAESFKIFNTKLTNYESSFGMDTDDVIYKDWEFRAELYERAELHLCQNSTEILVEYLDCLVEKREQMVIEIDEKMANSS